MDLQTQYGLRESDEQMGLFGSYLDQPGLVSIAEALINLMCANGASTCLIHGNGSFVVVSFIYSFGLGGAMSVVLAHFVVKTST